MKHLFRALGYNPRKYRVRQAKLRQRLLTMFFMDAMDGRLESLTRRVVK